MSAAEAQSYENEVRSLSAQLEAAEARCHRAEEATNRTAQKLADEMVQQYKEEERRRRQQLQGVLNTLREENTDLTAKLEAAKWTRGVGEGIMSSATGTASSVAAGTKLRDVEHYWRERLRTAEQNWEAEVQSQAHQLQDLNRVLQEVTRTSQELQESLRHARSEKVSLEGEMARLQQELLLQEHHSSGIDGPLRAQLRDYERRHEALMAQVEAYGEENTRMQVNYEHDLQQTRRELERERVHSAELVQLYSNQIQSLHEQLSAATRHRL